MTTITVPAKPTRLLIEKNAQGEMTKGRLEEVTLAYVRLQDGELAFGSETEKNLAVQAVVTKQTAKDFKSQFSKNGYREIPNDQFEKQFRIPPPYPEQEDQYILKLKANTTFQSDNAERNIKAGDLVPYEAPSRPKLYEIVDGKPVDITMTSRPANGSKGIVAFRVSTNKFGTFPILAGVVVTDLIESQQRASMESDYGITADTPSTNRKVLSAPAQDNERNEPEPQSSQSASMDTDWF